MSIFTVLFYEGNLGARKGAQGVLRIVRRAPLS